MESDQGLKKFILREEIPDLQLLWIPTGEVNWHTETIIEEKVLRVPLCREELVVERKSLQRDQMGTESQVEVARFILREERIDYRVQPFDIEAVHVDKRPIKDLQPVEIILQKEVLAVKEIKV